MIRLLRMLRNDERNHGAIRKGAPRPASGRRAQITSSVRLRPATNRRWSILPPRSGGNGMGKPREPEILIVGAGPVGLLAALLLDRREVRVAIIDQDRRTSQHSYALAIHPGTLRLLDEAGLADPLVERGRTLTRI